MKVVIALALCACLSANAQENIGGQKAAPIGPLWSFGLGGGFDYGGFGGQLHCRAARPLALFLGGGYALAGFGLNAGAEGRILPDAR